MRCLNCQNGFVYGFLPPRAIPCDICGGTHVIPKNLLFDHERGRKLHEERLAHGKTLRAYCLENNLDVCERSREERGFFKK